MYCYKQGFDAMVAISIAVILYEKNKADKMRKNGNYLIPEGTSMPDLVNIEGKTV